MSFKPNLAVIIGTLTVAVLYGIMKYAAPDQLANLTEKVTSPLKSELALGDKLLKPTGSISNPLQRELVLEDILPTNDAYKADANNTSQYEIAGFFVGQDEAVAPCKADYVILRSEDGKPRAKIKQCIVNNDKSSTTVVFNREKVSSIRSIVKITKPRIDNILVPLKQKFGVNDNYGRYVPDKFPIPGKFFFENTEVYSVMFPTNTDKGILLNIYPINDYLTLCPNNMTITYNSPDICSVSPDFDKSDAKYLVIYRGQLDKYSEIRLTTQEYNVEAKKLGIAIIPMPIPNTENMPCYQQGSCTYHERGSEIKCRNYAMWMYQDAGVLIKYRKDLGLGDEKTIEDTHDAIASRLDYPDRLFLYTVISNYVKNQEAGRQYVASGDFFTDCFNELTR